MFAGSFAFLEFPQSSSRNIVRVGDHDDEEVMVWLRLRLHCDLSPSAQGLSSSKYGSFLAVIHNVAVIAFVVVGRSAPTACAIAADCEFIQLGKMRVFLTDRPSGKPKSSTVWPAYFTASLHFVCRSSLLAVAE